MKSKNSTNDSGERLKVARDLHDTIAQEIAALGYACDEAISLAPAGSTRQSLVAIRERLTLLGTTLRDEIGVIRKIQKNFGASLETLIRELTVQSAIEIVNEIPHGLVLEKSIQLELYRSLRELLTNIIVHAGATKITLTCDRNEICYAFTISDDGIENKEGQSAKDFHFGAIGVRERLESINADFSYHRSNEGNIYRMILPI